MFEVIIGIMHNVDALSVPWTALRKGDSSKKRMQNAIIFGMTTERESLPALFRSHAARPLKHIDTHTHRGMHQPMGIFGKT